MNGVRWIQVIVIHPRWTDPQFWRSVDARIARIELSKITQKAGN